MKVSQNQMILPILETLSDSGGRVSTGDICDAVAEKLKIPEQVREERVWIGGKTSAEVKCFDRNVRWAQQTSKRMGLIEADDRPYWRLRGKGQDALKEALPGTVFTLFATDHGVALWGSCEDAVAYLENESVNLLFSSPPYPLQRSRPFGNVTADRYDSWFMKIAEKWPRIMARDSSVVVNFGDVWMPGVPHVSLYQEKLLIRLQEELGFHLCQKFYWHSTTRLALPKSWVAVRRVRVKSSVEQLFWLSRSDHPFASNREVLVPYSAKMRRTIAQGGERRQEIHPSGNDIRVGAYARDNGGAIPGNLLICPNAESNTSYVKGCKAAGLPIHPARFPYQLPNFFIRFLTRPGDLVYDPFGGSAVTAQEAEKLGRRWMTSEIIREYVEGSRYRFAS